MKDLDFWVNFLANLLTIMASSIAILLYVLNKEKISSALNTLLNYSNQLTLTDLRYKIERLNDFTVADPEQKIEVINILHEIEGQITGSKNLSFSLEEQHKKITYLISNPKTLSEPKKRSLVSELRESIRHLDIENFEKILKKQNSN